MHVDVEDARERRLLDQELQEGRDAGPQRGLGGRVRGLLPRRPHDPVGHQQAALAGGRQEAILLVAEVGVKRGPRHPGPADDVGHGDVAEAGLAHRGDDRPQQAVALHLADRVQGQAAAAAGEAGLTLVGTGQPTLLFRSMHGHTGQHTLLSRATHTHTIATT